jgi:hypothetical protein
VNQAKLLFEIMFQMALFNITAHYLDRLAGLAVTESCSAMQSIGYSTSG